MKSSASKPGLTCIFDEHINLPKTQSSGTSENLLQLAGSFDFQMASFKRILLKPGRGRGMGTPDGDAGTGTPRRGRRDGLGTSI